MRRERHVGRRGMSLVEVMIVIAIVLTLMAILGGIVMSLYGKSRVWTTELQVIQIGQAVDAYSLRDGVPTTEDGITLVYEDLGADAPVDAWGNGFDYVPPAKAEYDVVSFGSDGQESGSGNAADTKLSDVRAR